MSTVSRIGRRSCVEASAHSHPRFTLVLPRSEAMRSSAVSMAGAEHLGLGSIAAHLRAEGFPVRILNFQLSSFFNAWDGLQDPRPSYAPEALATEILATEPDVVGFCVTAMTIHSALAMAESIKSKRPRCLVGLGGPHAILSSQALFERYPLIDFLGLSDGERAMSLLGEAVAEGSFPCQVPGLLTRRPDKVVPGLMRTADGGSSGIEHLPAPARDDLVWMSLRAPIDECRLTTSRGCTYDCTFCIDAMRYGRKWWARSAEQTVDEIELLHRTLGINHFWLSDDNFLLGSRASRRRARVIADELLNRGLEVTYRARFRSDTFIHDSELLPHLAKSGLVAAFVGIEAGSPEQLERFNKRTTIHQHKRIVEDLRANGVALQCGFIMFEPYCNFDDIEASAEFLREISEMYLISNFTHSLDVFPGAELTEQLREDGLLSKDFNAASRYDEYEFANPDVGRLAKLIELAYDPETVTRDKWIYRYRTNLLPRAYCKLTDHPSLTAWKEREEAIVEELNEVNMDYFMKTIAEARRGEAGRRFDEYKAVAWARQEELKSRYEELYHEVRSALPVPPHQRPAQVSVGDWRGLPPEVAGWVERALAEVGTAGPVKRRMLTGGNLNYTVSLETEDGRYIFRARRPDAAAGIVDYLTGLYDCAGLRERGGGFRLRSVGEEVAFLRCAREAGLRVPRVVSAAEDWMLLEQVDGRPLGELLYEGLPPSFVLRLLHQLHLAHRAGLVIGDRWGNNELVDRKGHLHLIDFDVEWIEGPSDDGFLRDMDIAVALFGALLHSSRRKDLLLALREFGIPLLADWGYSLERIRTVLEGYERFYLDPDKPENPLSPDPAVYRTMVVPLRELRQSLGECRGASPRMEPAPVARDERDFLSALHDALATLSSTQRVAVGKAGKLIADRVRGGGVLHTFGCGHSALVAAEVSYRAGGLAPVNCLGLLPGTSGWVAATRAEEEEGLAGRLVDAGGVDERDVVAVVSHSGVSALVRAVLAESAARAAATLVVTSDPNCELARRASIVLATGVPRSDCVLQRGSYAFGSTSSIIALALLNAVITVAIERLSDDGGAPVFESIHSDGGSERNGAILERFASRVPCWQRLATVSAEAS